MVLEMPASSARTSVIRARTMRSLRELPTRRPEPPAPDDAAVQWARIDLDRYEIRSASGTVGFIDVVGAVFVVLAGRRYDRAVEILQTLDFTSAVEALASREP